MHWSARPRQRRAWAMLQVAPGSTGIPADPGSAMGLTAGLVVANVVVAGGLVGAVIGVGVAQGVRVV